MLIFGHFSSFTLRLMQIADGMMNKQPQNNIQCSIILKVKSFNPV